MFLIPSPDRLTEDCCMVPENHSLRPRLSLSLLRTRSWSASLLLALAGGGLLPDSVLFAQGQAPAGQIIPPVPISGPFPGPGYAPPIVTSGPGADSLPVLDPKAARTATRERRKQARAAAAAAPLAVPVVFEPTGDRQPYVPGSAGTGVETADGYAPTPMAGQPGAVARPPQRLAPRPLQPVPLGPTPIDAVPQLVGNPAPFPGARPPGVPVTVLGPQASVAVPQSTAADWQSIPFGSVPYRPEVTPLGLESANLVVTLSETLLNRLIEQSRTEAGLVQDQVLGAEVRGEQTTTTRLRIDLRPAADQAHGVFLLSGDIQSQTNALTPQAAINSIGRHKFQAVKDVYFNGGVFSTRHAMIFVKAQNENVGAITPLTGSAFGNLSERIALRVADNRRPAAEAVARQRVAEQVFPKFDSEVDRQLSEANQQLDQRVRQRLEAARLKPEAQHISSSENMLAYALQFPGPGSTVDPRTLLPQPVVPPGQAVPERLLTLSIHEGFLNGLVDRLGLAGQSTTDRSLFRMMEQIQGVLPGGAEIERLGTAPRGMAAIETQIELAEQDPIVFRITRGELRVVLRAKFRPAGQDLLPLMTVTVPFLSRLVEDRWVLEPGRLSVVSEGRSAEMESTLPERLVRESIEANLLRISFPAQLPTEAWKPGDTPPRLSLLEATPEGWLLIGLE